MTHMTMWSAGTRVLATLLAGLMVTAPMSATWAEMPTQTPEPRSPIHAASPSAMPLLPTPDPALVPALHLPRTLHLPPAANAPERLAPALRWHPTTDHQPPAIPAHAALTLQVASTSLVPALTTPSLHLTPPHSQKVQWTNADWANTWLIGLGAMILGGLGGVPLGRAYCNANRDPESRPFPDFGCLRTSIGFMLIGATLASSTVVWAYGALFDFDGSFAGSLAGGMFASLLVVMGLSAASSYESPAIATLNLVVLLVTPMIETLGYYITMSQAHKLPGDRSGLLNVAPGRGMALGLPSVQLGVEDEGFRVGVPLLSGSF